MRSLFLIVSTALFLLSFCSAVVSARDDEISLAEELEGLAPEPRIAYLNHLISEGRDDAEAYFQLAVAWHESSVPDSALLYYGKAIDRDSLNFKSFVNLGVLYDDSGDLIEAEKNFESAVKINPDDILANSHLAFMIFQQKRYDKAWEYLSRALELAPDHPQPRFYLAIFFWESKMYREAMREWEKVVEVDPGSYLADRARENIQLLQKVLNSPTPSESIDPVR